MGLHSLFQVVDHFTRFSLVPSVTMIQDVPERIEGLFYLCVYVCVCVCKHVYFVYLCVCMCMPVREV